MPARQTGIIILLFDALRAVVMTGFPIAEERPGILTALYQVLKNFGRNVFKEKP